MDRSVQIKALSSEVRLTILRLLAEPEKHFADQWSADPVEFGVCMTLIANALKIAQPTASRHVDLLKQAGFVTTQKREKWSHCKRNEPAIRDYVEWLSRELGLP
jgi:DNA-binding transcriptional ArsR family regulator